MADGLKPSHLVVPNQLIRCESVRLPVKPISCCGLGLHEGWHFRKKYPSDFNRPFRRLVHNRLVEHYVRTSDDLSVLGVRESVSDLAIGSVAEENPFP